jgi:flagellar biosynthesis chaperone FliJ
VDALEAGSLLSKRIGNVQLSIDSITRQMNQSQDDLERLKSTLSKLVSYQMAFDQHTRRCLEPELSPDMWRGTLSKDFDRFRRNEVQKRFNSLSNDQLDVIIVQLKQAITSTNLSISDLQGSLHTHRIRLDTLIELRRKESTIT